MCYSNKHTKKVGNSEKRGMGNDKKRKWVAEPRDNATLTTYMLSVLCLCTISICQPLYNIETVPYFHRI